MREFSQKWEGNPDYTTNTKTKASESLAQTKEDPNKALREAGGNYEKANNANLSGNKKLLTDYNGSQIMREFSQKWEGNPDYTTNTKTQESQSLAVKTINPNGPTGLVPPPVDQ